MSAEQPSPSYNEVFLKAWIILSVLLGLVLLGMFYFWQPLLAAGHIVWALLRWLASPII